MKEMLQKSAIIFLVFLLVMFWADFSFAATQEELQEAIKKKNEELQKINSQIQETQKQLEATQERGKTLKQEMTKLDKQISQLNLSIRSSEITIEKLNLEIESLQYDIKNTQTKIGFKKEVITAILRQLQQRTAETPLTVFLKNNQLSDSFFELQGLNDLNRSLNSEVSELKNFENQLNDSLNEAMDKNQQLKNENQSLKNKKYIAEDLKKEKQVLLQQTKNQEKIYQQQLITLEKIQSDTENEINKIQEELRLKINPSAIPAKGSGVLLKPTNTDITQGYGRTDFAIKHYKSQWHNGIDLRGPIGVPVFAAEKGKVVYVDNQDKYCPHGAYGKYIIIEHENNLSTLYAHLSLQTVKVGDEVSRGEIIGYVGNTGWATGPHLHFTVFAGRFNSPTLYMKQSKYCGPMPYGADVNPLDYIQP